MKAGEQCRAFGAAGINRLPTRIQISWQDDKTMKLDWDLGTQTRLVHFDKTKPPVQRRCRVTPLANGSTCRRPVDAAAVAAAPPAPAPPAAAAPAAAGARSAGAAGGGRAGAGRGGRGARLRLRRRRPEDHHET